MLWIYIDGASKGNPGPASYGMVVKNIEGRVVTQRSKYLGTKTNNQAEYYGMLAALEYLRTQNYPYAHIYSDSQLLVRQINGEYKVRNGILARLYLECKRYIRHAPNLQVKHIHRYRNEEADRLANEAILSYQLGERQTNELLGEENIANGGCP